MKILEPTAGLLVSMGMRYFHSFSFWTGSFEQYPTLEEKQLMILDEVADIYATRKFSKQLLEEVTGAGYYSTDLEGRYISFCTSRKVRVRAAELAKALENNNERNTDEN